MLLIRLSLRLLGTHVILVTTLHLQRWHYYARNYKGTKKCLKLLLVGDPFTWTSTTRIPRQFGSSSSTGDGLLWNMASSLSNVIFLRGGRGFSCSLSSFLPDESNTTDSGPVMIISIPHRVLEIKFWWKWPLKQASTLYFLKSSRAWDRYFLGMEK